jgi:hypothetical protein
MGSRMGSRMGAAGGSLGPHSRSPLVLLALVLAPSSRSPSRTVRASDASRKLTEWRGVSSAVARTSRAPTGVAAPNAPEETKGEWLNVRALGRENEDIPEL